MKLFILVEHTDLTVGGIFEYTNVGIYPSWNSATVAKLEFLEFEDAYTQYNIEECEFYPDGE